MACARHWSFSVGAAWIIKEARAKPEAAQSITRHTPVTNSRQGDSVTLHRWSLGVKGSFELRAPSLSLSLAGSMSHSLLSCLSHQQLPMIILNIHLYVCMLGLGRLLVLVGAHPHCRIVYTPTLCGCRALRRTWIRLAATQQPLIHLSSVWVYWTHTRLQ